MKSSTLWIAVCVAAIAVPARADDLFTETIQPLLESRCLSCHNSRTRKGGLSLESRMSLLQGGESGEVVIAGEPHSSYLLDLVTAHEGKAEMPKGGEPLSPDEIDSIRQWIENGLNWPENITLEPEIWWSLRPLENVEIPQVEPLVRTDGSPFPIRTPVDAFIGEALLQQGLVPSPEADRRTLIRRATFDLTGLPPTPEEIDAFVSDPDPLAYERLIDRLLDSPQYGERWARHWLDVVKYADTCGYDKDKLRRNAWPYRDFVIRSFNEDKPYSQFVKEQLAGDVFYPGEPDGIIALGFIAAGPWDHIGHVEVSESKIDGKIARSMDRDDMVSSAINTFCSATIQCARCHDHKFDPYSQEHYYGLQAVFAAVDRADRVYDLDPQIEQQRLQLANAVTEAQAKLRQIESQIQKEGGPRLDDLNARIKELKATAEKVLKSAEYGYHSSISSTATEEKWVQIELPEPCDLTSITMHACHDTYAGIGAGFGFPLRFRIQAVADESEWTTDPQAGLLVDFTQEDFPNPGLTPVTFPVQAHRIRFVRVTATHLAERSNDFIFALAELEVISDNKTNVALNSRVTSKDSIEATPRWSRRNLVDGHWPEAVDPEKVQQYADLVNERDQLLIPLQAAREKEMSALKESIRSAQAKLQSLPTGKLVYAAATHFSPRGNFRPTEGVPREVRVLNRGNVQDPGEIATPGALPVIPAVPAVFDLPENHSEGDRRAALAEWIVHPDHPLTWRSIVNRTWQYHFGEGLVATPNDFGRMGQQPTHPELLDWLAVHFRDEGQSFKELHRLLMTSSVYRQSTVHDSDNAAIDDSNRFLWRMNRRRLEAEEIRDAILSVSGALNSEMGGPGYFLFELEKEAHSPHYEYQRFDPADPSTHRRSIYRFVVRSQPDPYMTTLDCADSSQSTPRRSETVTALQALTLLNNRFHLLMCERFAQRLRDESSERSVQVRTGFELATGRAPTSHEQRQLTEFAEQHGLENLCRVLFNLNEFMYID